MTRRSSPAPDLPPVFPQQEAPPSPPAIVPRRLYSDDEKRAVIERICERIAEGGVSNTVGNACKAEGISRSMLFKWTTDDKQLGEIYAEARIWQAHATAEDTIELSDGAMPGKTGDVDKVRLQVDTRKWFVTKIAPRIYGDRIEMTGAGGIPLLPPSATRTDLSKLTTEQLIQLATLTELATVPVEPEVPALAAGDGVNNG